MLTLREVEEFFKKDGKFKWHHADYDTCTCEICGCIVDMFYLHIHRLKCYPSNTRVETITNSTYEIGREGNHLYILCKKCGSKSFNGNDIGNLFCGSCHEFHK